MVVLMKSHSSSSELWENIWQKEPLWSVNCSVCLYVHRTACVYIMHIYGLLKSKALASWLPLDRPISHSVFISLLSSDLYMCFLLPPLHSQKSQLHPASAAAPTQPSAAWSSDDDSQELCNNSPTKRRKPGSLLYPIYTENVFLSETFLGGIKDFSFFGGW